MPTLLIFLFCFPFFISAAEKPKAADLVKDGQAIDLASERYAKLFDELQVQHNFSREELDRLFAGVSIDKKVLELMDRQWEAKPYYQYRPLFITRKTISKGKKMLSKHQELLDRIETLELAGEPKRAKSTFVGGLKSLPIRYSLSK